MCFCIFAYNQINNALWARHVGPSFVRTLIPFNYFTVLNLIRGMAFCDRGLGSFDFTT